MYKKYIQPIRHRILSFLGLKHTLEEDSYVGTYIGSIRSIGRDLSDLGFNRNPVAWLKFSDIYGVAEASWVKREHLLAPMQLHVTLQYVPDKRVTHVYAHYEYNWITHPILHLRSKDVYVEEGIEMTRELLEDNLTYGRMVYNYGRNITE